MIMNRIVCRILIWWVSQYEWRGGGAVGASDVLLRRARRDVAAALALAALWWGRAPRPHRKHRGARR